MHRTVLYLAAALTSLGLVTGCASSGHSHHHHHGGSATIYDSEPTIGEIPQSGPTYGQLEGEGEGAQTW